MADTDTSKKNGKKGGKLDWQKNKWMIIVAGVLVLGVLYFVVKRANTSSSSAGSSTASTGTASGAADPATGYLYGSPADLAALGNGSTESGSTSTGSTQPVNITVTVPPTSTGTTGTTTTGTGTTTTTPPVTAKPGGGGGLPAPKPITKLPASTAASSRYYTVKSGDNLWNIAKSIYGNGADYTAIYNANRTLIGSNPNMIHPGQRLLIPSKG